MRPRRALDFTVSLLLVAGAYFVAGKLGLTLAAVHPSATAIWPGTGIALASLLALGYRLWPGIFVGAFLVNATTAGSIVTALGIASGNTLEALVGTWLVNRFTAGPDPIDRAPDTFRYAGLVGFACMLSPTIGIVSLSLTGFAPWADAGPIWLTWWLGDMGGALVVAPFLLLWGRDHRVRPRGARVGEAAALIACLVILGWTVFRWVSPLSLGISLMFLCVPPLIWAAFRFDQRMAATAVLLLAALAVGGTLGRFGPAQRSELNQSLLVLQVFLGVMAVTTLALAAVVAERRRAARAVESTSDELREAVAQLEAFSHAISHDLRSPLSTVLNYSMIIEEDYSRQIGPEGTRMLGKIQAAVDSAKRLLDQLTQFAGTRRERGEREVVDMAALAHEAYAEVATGDQDAGHVRFAVGELPRAVGNSALLLRVFHNLLGNAVKYTRGREQRRIEVSGVAGRAENTYFVTDNGIGFDRADGDALFEPFRRGRAAAQGYEGSGLGLAIVARIVRKHGGRIWAESDGSTGARFGFTLENDEDGT
ncbi:MAG: MASE1 domain-containing protein [Candidatus Eiseniibacteriota bacterium]